VPYGFGSRGIEGKIAAIRYARENKVPFFGICLGMQMAVIEYARHVAGIADASSGEFTPDHQFNVVDLMPEQQGVTLKGGTMRLGAYPAVLGEGTQIAKIYGKKSISERHRHRFEVNNAFVPTLKQAGLIISGTSPDGSLAETIELKGHPWFIGCQFHPEFKSKPFAPHPLFKSFVKAAVEHSKRYEQESLLQRETA
jgi:CTP synthase